MSPRPRRCRGIAYGKESTSTPSAAAAAASRRTAHLSGILEHPGRSRRTSPLSGRHPAPRLPPQCWWCAPRGRPPPGRSALGSCPARRPSPPPGMSSLSPAEAVKLDPSSHVQQGRWIWMYNDGVGAASRPRPPVSLI
ncbi:hypothetical protein PAHAL_2G350100 [Panicum hallii]|jgi:hypothetical protein|uniref:Uncharacterized protein n=1 Tax=Panicum hallii TaxID=206008 RepID=A0A2S3H1U0_9POAL|nr:hypothetical protein PAHAL_2G350100 [Panicum hallii]